jgi:O-antigen ligase
LNVYLHGSRAADRLEGYGTGDTANANQFGVLLISIIPFTIPFIFHGKWYERLICLLGLPFLINTFILCNSRGAAVAFILGLMLVMLLLPDKVIRRYILLGVLVSIPTLIYLADAQFIDRMETLMSTKDAASDEDDIAQLSSGRTVIWGYGLDMAKDYPMGVGPNGFKKLARFYMPPEVLTFTPGKENGSRAAHNTYLQTLVEHGVIGLIIILLMMLHSLLLLRSSLKKIQETQKTNSFLGLSVFALALSLSTTIFAGLTSSRVFYEFFWWQIALSVVMYSLVKKSLNSTPDST